MITSVSQLVPSSEFDWLASMSDHLGKSSYSWRPLVGLCRSCRCTGVCCTTTGRESATRWTRRASVAGVSSSEAHIPDTSACSVVCFIHVWFSLEYLSLRRTVTGSHSVALQSRVNSTRLHRELGARLFWRPLPTFSTPTSGRQRERDHLHLEVRTRVRVAYGKRNATLRIEWIPAQYSYGPRARIAIALEGCSLESHWWPHVQTWSGLSAALPVNVQIATLQQWAPGCLLLRLEHLYQPDEHPLLARNVSVDLAVRLRLVTVLEWPEHIHWCEWCRLASMSGRFWARHAVAVRRAASGELRGNDARGQQTARRLAAHASALEPERRSCLCLCWAFHRRDTNCKRC